ncbi:hypothetical protein E5676_scaffold85G00830 [Cucumis melo var. makuwa]|nr:hypothetical protein E5676_scaffold85G00830 [Cucumis melo var. makuwa]
MVSSFCSSFMNQVSIPLSDPTSTGGRLGFCHEIYRPRRSDRVPSSFGNVTLSSAIQLLLGDGQTFCRQIHCSNRSDRTPSRFGEVTLPSVIQLPLGDDWAFVVRSTTLVGAIRHLRTFVILRSDSIVSDLTFTKGRSSFYRQIYRPGRSNRTPSSFGEVALPSAFQLLLGGDRAFTVRSIALVGVIRHLHRLERSDRAPSLFGEVTSPSLIRLLLGDDRTFGIRSITLVGAIGH